MANVATQGSELRLRWRYLKDRLARHAVAIGGLGVIAAILLIFFYLFYIVIPLFLSAEIEAQQPLARPGTAESTLYDAIEEQGEIALRIATDGQIIFYDLSSGKVREQRQIKLPPDARLTAIAPVDEDKGLMAIGTDQGDVLVVRHSYKTSYPDDIRLITPQLTFPLGEEWIHVTDDGIDALAVRQNEDRVLIAVITSSGGLLIYPLNKTSSLFDDEITLEAGEIQDLNVPLSTFSLIMTPGMQWLYAASRDGRVAFYDIRRLENIVLNDVVKLTGPGKQLTALTLLSGGISLISGDSSGNIEQWFPVRDESNRYQLSKVRDFEKMGDAPISVIEAEKGRRGFLVADTDNHIGIYYATSGRHLLTHDLGAAVIKTLAIAPRANWLIAESEYGNILPFRIHNEHPEISWNALWGKVWYESYAEEDYVWQSSSASNDFEPKFSLVPLSFGTLKAAFYAMLFAMPLAIMGAIYTAYFMAPRMRGLVKPTVEVMEALPTVILGFLAGLWLAPIVESHLPGLFSILLLLPVVLITFAFLWSLAPAALRDSVPEGWQAALLMPVILLFGWLCISLSGPLELWLFDGSMPLWMDTELGISYDQRNALVVGLAMGFAVIPTIFSIAEDAIFSVPKHLSNGSLALGATPWQTLVRVVLPTASPGIFSSVMIGMGRAVGETMIVLMATGNTPVMDGSPFQGMRTLSANIAVEMPEAEVDSTHFRILFLAGLVLFMFTFIFNTLAELVRQRLREKYSSL